MIYNSTDVDQVEWSFAITFGICKFSLHDHYLAVQSAHFLAAGVCDESLRADNNLAMRTSRLSYMLLQAVTIP